MRRRGWCGLPPQGVVGGGGGEGVEAELIAIVMELCTLAGDVRVVCT